MLHSTTRVILILFLVLTGCKPKWWIDPVDATGGPFQLTLPFPSGEYWQLTQGPGGVSHKDWGFSYGDDRFALDFSQAGCKPYGKAVTPIAPGRGLCLLSPHNGQTQINVRSFSQQSAPSDMNHIPVAWPPSSLYRVWKIKWEAVCHPVHVA